MAETRQKFTPDFREGAVRIVEESGKPIAQVARDPGTGSGTPARWRSRSGAGAWPGWSCTPTGTASGAVTRRPLRFPMAGAPSRAPGAGRRRPIP
ncbi:hypothetical protein GCM10010517_51760 [Streptosporangium fragile]|uniref:Transposase n=1 Tax=Streptosporangium fragile TaxID=46186 RepID=A0ABN3W360_9ACTN